MAIPPKAVWRGLSILARFAKSKRREKSRTRNRRLGIAFVLWYLSEMASKQRGRPPLFGKAMTATEHQRRWRAKVNAAWQAECEQVGPLWGLVGSKPISRDDLDDANPSKP